MKSRFAANQDCFSMADSSDSAVLAPALEEAVPVFTQPTMGQATGRVSRETIENSNSAYFYWVY
jgi:hypothetical protein